MGIQIVDLSGIQIKNMCLIVKLSVIQIDDLNSGPKYSCILTIT